MTGDQTLPERLRSHVCNRLPSLQDGPLPKGAWQMMLDAAAKIDRLEYEHALLRGALKPFAEEVTTTEAGALSLRSDRGRAACTDLMRARIL